MLATEAHSQVHTVPYFMLPMLKSTGLMSLAVSSIESIEPSSEQYTIDQARCMLQWKLLLPGMHMG